jgi:hypothetical protein
MDRSFSRIAVLATSMAAVGLLAGCASGAPGGAVLGVPDTSTSSSAQPSGDFLAGLQEAITSELGAVAATQSGADGPSQLNALNSISSLSQYEQLRELLALGANQTSKRELVVNALVSDVKGNSYVSNITIGGRSLSGSLLSILDGVDAQLQSMATAIAGTTLTDVLRVEILAINTSTRVSGLVEPQVHLALAGGDELYEVNTLAGRLQTLTGQVNAAAGSPHYASEVALLEDLTARLNSSRSTIDSVLTSVLSLTPGGFPANKATILSARAQLSQLRAPLGNLSGANGDAAQLVQLLS